MGIFKLRGANWSRWGYVVVAVLGYAFSLSTSPLRALTIPGVLLTVVIVCFLFTRRANAFFRAESSVLPPPLS